MIPEITKNDIELAKKLLGGQFHTGQYRKRRSVKWYSNDKKDGYNGECYWDSRMYFMKFLRSRTAKTFGLSQDNPLVSELWLELLGQYGIEVNEITNPKYH